MLTLIAAKPHIIFEWGTQYAASPDTLNRSRVIFSPAFEYVKQDQMHEVVQSGPTVTVHAVGAADEEAFRAVQSRSTENRREVQATGIQEVGRCDKGTRVRYAQKRRSFLQRPFAAQFFRYRHEGGYPDGQVRPLPGFALVARI